MPMSVMMSGDRRIGLFKELVPTLTRLGNTGNPDTKGCYFSSGDGGPNVAR